MCVYIIARAEEEEGRAEISTAPVILKLFKANASSKLRKMVVVLLEHSSLVGNESEVMMS